MQTVQGPAYNTVELRTAFEDFRKIADAQLNEYLNEIEKFNFTYSVDLDEVTADILYNDLRILRGWRNRLAQIIRAAIRLQGKGMTLLSNLMELHRSVTDCNLINGSTERISRGMAIQERVADAGLGVLDLRKLVVDVTNFSESTKAAVQMLNDKRHDLRDACQEVQAVQALLTLSMSTAE